MKTLTDITLLIFDITNDIFYLKNDPSKKRQAKKLRNQLEHLKVCKLYIETCPSADFIEQEIRRLTGRKNAIMKFKPDGPVMNKEYKAKIKQWERDQGIEKINKQLKTLNFLIK